MDLTHQITWAGIVSIIGFIALIWRTWLKPRLQQNEADIKSTIEFRKDIEHRIDTIEHDMKRMDGDREAKNEKLFNILKDLSNEIHIVKSDLLAGQVNLKEDLLERIHSLELQIQTNKIKIGTSTPSKE